jgi:hypothetical protein
MVFLPLGAALIPTADAQRKVPARASVADLQQRDIRTGDRPKSVFPTLEHPPHEPSIDECGPFVAKTPGEYDFPPLPLPESE